MSIFVYGIPPHWSEIDLQRAFMIFGPISEANVVKDKVSGKGRGFGFVTFVNPNSCELAIRGMNGFSVGQGKLKVALKSEKRQNNPYWWYPYWLREERWINNFSDLEEECLWDTQSKITMFPFSTSLLKIKAMIHDLLTWKIAERNE